jgi:hypothetical protein
MSPKRTCSPASPATQMGGKPAVRSVVPDADIPVTLSHYLVGADEEGQRNCDAGCRRRSEIDDRHERRGAE